MPDAAMNVDHTPMFQAALHMAVVLTPRVSMPDALKFAKAAV
jgi:hypothetical protein